MRSRRAARVLTALLFSAAACLAAAPTGPTLILGDSHGRNSDNPLAQFMYFVPLISPEPVFVITNAGNTQCARVTSSVCKASDGAFLATCDFDFIGAGFQRDILDIADLIHRHEQELKRGGSLKRQLASISVEGDGSGSVEVEGAVTNGVYSVHQVRMRFNCDGKPSPVTIGLQDITCRNDRICVEKEIIARVNTLTFQSGGAPRMEVTLASVMKQKHARETLWRDFIGDMKGMLVNPFLPPFPIAAAGRQAMLDFGQALASGSATFTFPLAAGLENAPAARSASPNAAMARAN